MKSYKLELPIYYTKEYKTKNSKTFMVALNWYKNSNHFLSNEVKKRYHSLVKNNFGMQKMTNWKITKLSTECILKTVNAI